MHISSLVRGERAKANALAALLVFGVLGWAAAIGSFNWLTSHDSGDANQYIGELWLLTMVLAFCGASLALVSVSLNRKSKPLVGYRWLPVVIGGSFVLGIVCANIFLLLD